jgi:hypothetical protein
VLIGGNNQFATQLKRHFVFSAEVDQQSVATKAVGGFKTARFVINAGMYDSAIISGLVLSKFILLFKNEKPKCWICFFDLESCG